MSLSLLFRRLLALLVVGSALALSISYRTASVGPEDFPDSIRPVGLTREPWQPQDAVDWLQQAWLAERKGDLSAACMFSLNALETDVSNAKALVNLAKIASREGQMQQAVHFADLAGQLATAQDSTQAFLADFWAKTGKRDRQLAALDVLLVRGGRAHSRLFPQLQALLQTATSRPLFDPWLKQPPAWWPAFFSYLIRDPQTSPDLLASLFRQQLANRQAISEAQARQYVAYLIQRKQWHEARDVWLETLPAEYAPFKGLVYDGSFEGRLHNTGFDWSFNENAQVDIKQRSTFGAQGNKALRVILRDKAHINFQHVWQRLVLPPGQYTWGFQYRIDRMNTLRGLQWRVRCEGDERVLAESGVMRDMTPWVAQSMPLHIPADCPVQLLRLEASSPYAYEQVFDGDIWFDGMEMKPGEVKPDAP